MRLEASLMTKMEKQRAKRRSQLPREGRKEEKREARRELWWMNGQKKR